ncbi:hypothetical protein B0O80DRAFT_463482 [Mortierella sp. GBAus27b]|nr:hypothetical protein B0O80DRAFT_463482 [Mortierella sp. GBAus27b]
MLKPTTAPASYTIEHDRSLQIPVAYPQHEGCWWGVERAIVVSRFSKAPVERLITLFSRAGPLSWPVLLIGAPLVLCLQSSFVFPPTMQGFSIHILPRHVSKLHHALPPFLLTRQQCPRQFFQEVFPVHGDDFNKDTIPWTISIAHHGLSPAHSDGPEQEGFTETIEDHKQHSSMPLVSSRALVLFSELSRSRQLHHGSSCLI